MLGIFPERVFVCAGHGIIAIRLIALHPMTVAFRLVALRDFSLAKWDDSEKPGDVTKFIYRGK